MRCKFLIALATATTAVAISGVGVAMEAPPQPGPSRQGPLVEGAPVPEGLAVLDPSDLVPQTIPPRNRSTGTDGPDTLDGTPGPDEIRGLGEAAWTPSATAGRE